MTIHGSKGSRVPGGAPPGARDQVYARRSAGVADAAAGRLSAALHEQGDHDAEEECLFFVGLSRARDYLSLTRAHKYTAAQNASASKFLSALPASRP
jgi:superfamily I DNA/RNA helicase